jgi:hypothetical protein
MGTAFDALHLGHIDYRAEFQEHRGLLTETALYQRPAHLHAR